MGQAVVEQGVPEALVALGVAEGEDVEVAVEVRYKIHFSFSFGQLRFGEGLANGVPFL